MSTLTTEFIAGRDFGLTVRTGRDDLRPTLTAKPIVLGIFRLALRALHFPFQPGQVGQAESFA